MPLVEVERLDRELARVGRGSGPIRLRLGEAVEALGRSGGHHELGFPSMSSYSLERLERPGRFAAESRAMARRVAALPCIRAALAAGEISWSMADVLSRRASPADEEALLEDARGTTVRAMRAKLPAKSQHDPDPDDDAPLRTLTTTVTASEAWAFECARLLVRAIDGTKSDEGLVYALLAEGETTLVNLSSFDLDASPERALAKRDAEHRALRLAWQREAEEACEDSLDRAVEAPGPASTAPLPSSPRALDALLRGLAADLAAKDAVMGDLARRLFDANGWRRLGYASESQYARERVGCSLASLRGRMTLSRRAARLPAVTDALASGRTGYEHAALVARVATPGTVDAWLARADERTTLHLREEVEAVEMLARVSGDAAALDLGPPDAETIEAARAMRRGVMTGEVFQMSGGRPEAEEAVGGARTRLRSGAGMRTLLLRVTEDTYWQWKALERAFRRSGAPGTFAVFLCRSLWESWKHLAKKGKRFEVLLRDLFECTSPVCGERGVEDHHLEPRARGGGDEVTNRACACGWCHREGIHGGRLRADPPAPDVTWWIGREPILKVMGRTKVEVSGR